MSTRVKTNQPGFTLIELLVVIAIIGILAAIIFPVFSSAREKARQSQCINNQRQIAMAMGIYAQDYGKYPDTTWYSEINLDNKVLVCPDLSSQPYGYGINCYLTGLKYDTITRPSNVVLTTDATTTTTDGCDFTRHNKGAIISRVDGSAIWVSAKTLPTIARFSCGIFPINPEININGKMIADQPSVFTTYPAGSDAYPSAQFEYAGPFGDPTVVNQNPLPPLGALVGQDYIGENGFVTAQADAAPNPGDFSPNFTSIVPPLAGADLTFSNGSIHEFPQWTAVHAYNMATDATMPYGIQMELPQNYNCQFQFRTTYGVIYIYTPQAIQGSAMAVTAHFDDGGIVWLNGLQMGLYATAPGNNNPLPLTWPLFPQPVGPTSIPCLPAGISYMVVKDTNYMAGMKWAVDFQIPAGVTVGFSNTLP